MADVNEKNQAAQCCALSRAVHEVRLVLMLSRRQGRVTLECKSVSGWIVGVLWVVARNQDFVCFLEELARSLLKGEVQGVHLLTTPSFIALTKPDGSV